LIIQRLVFWGLVIQRLLTVLLCHISTSCITPFLLIIYKLHALCILSQMSPCVNDVLLFCCCGMINMKTAVRERVNGQTCEYSLWHRSTGLRTQV
jgi:hypothetical protein